MKRRLATVSGLLLWCSLLGCGQTFGGLLYHFNLLHDPSIPAQFKLTTGPLLILVDDDLELMNWPPGRDLLTDEVGRRLREARANARAIPSQTINDMRRADPKFAERSISELGKELGVAQVLWLQVREFVATTKIESVARAARCTVGVKVFDPNVKNKAEMRLWPAYREGESVTVAKSAGELTGHRKDEDVARMLVTETADQVAKLFYRHRPEE